MESFPNTYPNPRAGTLVPNVTVFGNRESSKVKWGRKGKACVSPKSVFVLEEETSDCLFCFPREGSCHTRETEQEDLILFEVTWQEERLDIIR